jgi:hypothetical protein
VPQLAGQASTSSDDSCLNKLRQYKLNYLNGVARTKFDSINFKLDILSQLKRADAIKLLNFGLKPIEQRQRFKKSHSVNNFQAREIRKIHYKFSLHKKSEASPKLDFQGSSPNLIKQMKNKMHESIMSSRDEPVKIKM